MTKNKQTDDKVGFAETKEVAEALEALKVSKDPSDKENHVEMSRTSSRARSDSNEAPKKRSRQREEVQIDLGFNNFLDIPEYVKDLFLEKGEVLRWVRINQGKEFDRKNVSARAKLGWKFVYPEDLPQEFLAQFEVVTLDDGRLDDLVVFGDVALASNKIENVEKLKRLQREAAMGVEERLSATVQETGYVPSDTSSKVYQGRRPAHFNRD